MMFVPGRYCSTKSEFESNTLFLLEKLIIFIIVSTKLNIEVQIVVRYNTHGGSHMIAVNYSQTRANMKSIMDRATYNCETIIITRKNNENVVMLSEDTYNNLLENAHLTSEKANFDWLLESKKQLESKKVTKHDFIKDTNLK